MLIETESHERRNLQTPPKLEIFASQNELVGGGRDTTRSTQPTERDEQSLNTRQMSDFLKCDLDQELPEVLKKKQEKSQIITRDSTLTNLGSFRENNPPTTKYSPDRIDESIDWYGNTHLHNMFASHDTDPADILKAIQEHPFLVSQTNQFGRIPLHYAVDRGKVNTKGLEILLQYYPKGVELQDNEGQTPYDIAIKWNHSKSIMLLLLTAAPDVDRANYMKLKYGPIGSLAHWARSSFRNSKTFSELDQDPDQHQDLVTASDHDNTLLEEETTTAALTGGGISRSGTMGDITIFAPALSRAQSRRFSADLLQPE